MRSVRWGRMTERPGTRLGRRAVKRLIERYFVELKKRLKEQNDAFWAKIKSAPAGTSDQERGPTEKP
jgi:hypothetical protein